MDLDNQSKDIVGVHSLHNFLVPWDEKYLKIIVHGLQETNDKKGMVVSLTRWSEGVLGLETKG